MSRLPAYALIGRGVAAIGAALMIVSLFLTAFNFDDGVSYWDYYRRMDVVFLVLGVAALVMIAVSLVAFGELMLAAVAVIGGAGLGFFAVDVLEYDVDESAGAYVANAGSLAILAGAAIALVPTLVARSGASRDPAFLTPETPASVEPAPGWYADPSGQSRLRYWDGKAWTEQTQE